MQNIIWFCKCTNVDVACIEICRKQIIDLYKKNKTIGFDVIKLFILFSDMRGKHTRPYIFSIFIFYVSNVAVGLYWMMFENRNT